MKKKSRTKRNRLVVTILICVVVVLGCIFLIFQILNQSKQNAQLKARKERLLTLLEEERNRSQELEDEKAYEQTQKYIEEKAKSIGYVYPDEIIFRKDD